MGSQVARNKPVQMTIEDTELCKMIITGITLQVM